MFLSMRVAASALYYRWIQALFFLLLFLFENQARRGQKYFESAEHEPDKESTRSKIISNILKWFQD